jgi:hypothetical protein
MYYWDEDEAKMNAKHAKPISRELVVKRLKRLQRQRNRLDAERDKIDEQMRHIRKHCCEHKKTDYEFDGVEQQVVCRDCGLSL